MERFGQENTGNEWEKIAQVTCYESCEKSTDCRGRPLTSRSTAFVRTVAGPCSLAVLAWCAIPPYSILSVREMSASRCTVVASGRASLQVHHTNSLQHSRSSTCRGNKYTSCSSPLPSLTYDINAYLAGTLHPGTLFLVYCYNITEYYRCGALFPR